MNKDKILFIPKQYIGIIAVLLAIIMSVLDGTIMNIALPTLTESFDISPATSIWIVNAYQLVITISFLAFASVGEIVGYRKVFLLVFSVFTLSSLACAFCDSFATLTTARVIQGFGAAAIMSVNPALIRLIYPPQVLGRGMGINAMVIAVSAAAGPSIAGSILAIASWHWLFLINVPIGIVAFIMGKKLLPKNTHLMSHKFDIAGAVMNALTFGLFIFALDGLAHSENYTLIIIETILFIVIGYLFVKRELSRPAPLLPVDLLKIPIFTFSICTSIASFAAQMLAMISLPFFMQNVLHYNPVEIGLLLTPWPLASIISAPLAGRLVEKVHPGLLGALGMSLFAAGLFLLYILPSNPSSVNIIWRMALCGFGFGLFQTPNNVTIVSSAPPQRSGGASGMLGSARLVGQTVGTTLVAFLFNIFPVGHRSESCIFMAIIFALGAAIVSIVRMKEASPIKKKK